MPNARTRETMYVVTGNPDTLNESWADFTSLGGHQGELGAVLPYNDREYQLVRLDSGADATTPVGVVAANQLAFWKDRATYLVTNNRDQAFGGSATASYANQVAGVFRCAATAGHVCLILQKGDNIPLLDGGNTFAVGEAIIAEAAAVAAVDRLAVAAAATYQLLGRARGASAAGIVRVDLNIAYQP